MRYILNLTVNWIGEKSQAIPTNGYFNQLVADCIGQLKLGAETYCFTEEQRISIFDRFSSGRYKLIFREIEGIIEIRRVLKYGRQKNKKEIN